MKLKLLFSTLIITFGVLINTVYGQTQETKLPIADQFEYKWETFTKERNWLNNEVVKRLRTNSELISILVIEGKSSRRKRTIIKFIENYLVKSKKINPERVHVVAGAERGDNQIEFRLYLVTRSQFVRQGLPEY